MDTRDNFIDPHIITQKKIGEYGGVLSDEEKNKLLDNIRSKGCDHHTAEVLTVSYLQMMFREARRRHSQDADVEDAYQNYIVKLLQNVGNFDPDRSGFGNFVHLQIRSIEYATRSKAMRRVGKFERVDEDVEELGFSPEEAERRCILIEDVAALRKAMTMLKQFNAGYHSVLVRYFGLGSERPPMNLPEIAEEDGITKSAISSKYRKGVSYIREIMTSNTKVQNNDDHSTPPKEVSRSNQTGMSQSV
ncbi:hypothetical protein CL635_03115 [bacterium]|nr:hypothetical protein [bacterium]